VISNPQELSLRARRACLRAEALRLLARNPALRDEGRAHKRGNLRRLLRLTLYPAKRGTVQGFARNDISVAMNLRSEKELHAFTIREN